MGTTIRTPSPQDPLREYKDLATSNLPCSQPRKVSIGVTAESIAKSGTKIVDCKKAILPTANTITSSKGKAIQAGYKVEAVPSAANPPAKLDDLPSISTNIFFQAQSASVAQRQQPLSAICSEFNAGNRASSKCGHQVVTNSSSVLNSGDRKRGNKNQMISERSKGDVDSALNVERSPFAPVQVDITGKDVVEDKAVGTEIKRSEDLRTKLWEILGNAASPKKQCSNYQPKDAQKEPQHDVQRNFPDKQNENSDSIECDSETLGQSIKRPVTRSFTQKRAHITSQVKKARCAPSKNPKDVATENIFPMKKQQSGRRFHACTIENKEQAELKKRKCARNNFLLPDQETAVGREPESRSKIVVSPEKYLSDGEESTHDDQSPEQVDRKILEPINCSGKIDFNESPVEKMAEQPEDAINGLKEQGNMEKHEDLADFDLKNIFGTRSGIQRFNFPAERAGESSSPGYSPERKHGKANDHSPQRIFRTKGIQCSKSSSIHTNSTSCNDEGKFQISPIEKTATMEENVSNSSRLSQSSSEEKDSDKSDDSLHTKGCGKSQSLSPEIGISWEPNFRNHSNKRPYSGSDIRYTGYCPPSATLEGNRGSCKVQKHFGRDQDSFTDAVSLFSIALERIRQKLELFASKRSADILMSVADKVHSELRNAESCQQDMLKLTALRKSKRKCMEAVIQEKQERLKLIYEKFKKEISGQIQECKTMIEGLEAHQMELTATIEKQKASQKKLLLLVKDSIETQLHDAEREITTINKLATRKMLQLKNVIAECLKECLYS